MNRVQLLILPIVVLFSIMAQKGLSGENRHASPARTSPPVLSRLASAAENGGMFLKEAVFGAGQYARDAVVENILHASAPASATTEAASKAAASASRCAEDTADKVRAEAFLIEDAKTHEIFSSRNAEKQWPIASVTKLMTAAVAAEQMNPDETVRISDEAVAAYGVAGKFRAGEVFTLRDLIKAMLVTSSNDAAAAIAEQMGENKFIEAMLRKAEELKMHNTVYVDATGLSPLNQSTADDLVKLAHYVIDRSPELFLISRQEETKIVELETNRTRILANIDAFAGSKEFLGGKTGFIGESGRNLVALFGADGHLVLTVVLGAENALSETKTLLRLCSLSMQ